jgi:Uncharacterized protein containing caspase domain
MKTLALVIGNNEYHESEKLKNAVNDAIAIKEVFEKLRFKIIFKTNFSANDIPTFLSDFAENITNYDASVFYFAGHGFELEGENYLAPIDTQIPPANKYEADRSCIRLSEIIDIHKKNSRKIHIVILDACRKSFDRGSTIGFSPIQAAKGTLIAFSTSPNEGASDIGSPEHSVYTGALLQYIGRERLSVEDLFKNVRKTVYDLTEGKQTTWEHTSLIGDYCFNEGQIIYHINIPYDKKVVKDADYDDDHSEFGKLIMAIKSHTWDKQNLAIKKLLATPIENLNENQQFILGRNLLQAADGATRNAKKFMDSIKYEIPKYNLDGENHLLNGILFEIYFNSHGDFRMNKTKKGNNFEEIINLRKIDALKKSFDFINKLLIATEYPLIYLPKQNDEVLDISIIATEVERKDIFGQNKKSQIISSIIYKSVDIIKQMAKLYFYRYELKTEDEFKKDLACFFTAPISLIEIHPNIKLSLICFDENALNDI